MKPRFRFSVQDDNSVIVIEAGKSRTFDGDWPVAAMLRQLIFERETLRVRVAELELQAQGLAKS